MGSKPFFACAVLLIAIAAAAVTPASAAGANPIAMGGGSDETATTCVPTLERLLSCLDFIEHRTDAIPLPCCVQVNTTVAQQPCCLMHVLRGDVARLMGPDFDSTRAMVNVTSQCLGDGSILMSITRSCAGKPLPPLTPEYPFTAALPPPPPSSSGAERLEGLSYAVLLVALVASFL
ncbi:hypothetical protein CFC21_021906 [Triticum aestivum]|uniref:Bifunctional inhibitor/plant lipid transfer protein/seed storage helical domain-containing protein n=2 Tax=Triticum aestivum TaxID=4565 RepID=A0A9R1EAM3_WHEAT|nr:non-specific lipid-transfer protein C6-like [Triticum aestivum]KAF7006923.1 hypothetical protein CFC21_021906 [Triticum aestivum]